MQIGELADRTGVSVRALRHYEARRLISSQRLENGFRSFPADAVTRVEHVRSMLACGFSTRQIADFLPCLGDPDAFDPIACAAGLAKHRAKLREIEALIVVLERRRDRLAERIRAFGRHRGSAA